jgi:glyoxylase-like metal-dependent hydrolase (beta-lactamase superfamily II)
MPALSAPLQLSPHLHIVYAEYPHVDCANVYLITGTHPTLIDSGSPRGSARLIENLARLGMTIADIDQVIVTHGDYDHIQGSHALHEGNPGLRLYLHPNDWPVVEGDDAYRNSSYVYRLPFVPFEAGSCLPVEDGDVLKAGDGELTVVHMPGHTEGSIGLVGEIDGRSVLFAGDAIGGSMKSLQGAAVDLWVQAAVTWQQSLQRLSTLDFEWVLNGHEPVESLPITRTQVDRLVRSFGTMLNPWFSLEDEDPGPSIVGGQPIVPLVTI